MALLNAFLRNIINFYFYKKYRFFSWHITIESRRSEGESIIKDKKNVFRLRKELNYTEIKDLRNLFRIEKETKEVIKIRRDISNLFEHEQEENYCKPVILSKFWSNIKVILNNRKKSETWKI